MKTKAKRHGEHANRRGARLSRRSSGSNPTVSISSRRPRRGRKREKIQEAYLTEIRPIPWWKRGFDLVIATLLIVALAPVLLAVALYIRLVSPGPILFIQERIGLGGRAFPILKFRSMMHRVAPSDEEHRRHVTRLAQTQAPLVKPDVGDCLIPGGEWLRRLSLDELPQLFNVLKGEMSLIGPRPDVLRFTDYTPRQLRRFAVAPGMTGLWQVSGKNRLSFDQMIDLDLYYVEHRSFLLDLWILLRTIPVLWGANGV